MTEQPQAVISRIVTLDFIRGFAVLGILLLNMVAFALPDAAYLNPAWQGQGTDSDRWVWAGLDLLAQLKFLTLFAILFGAGLQLLLPRGNRWLRRRLLWLVVFGLLHTLLFWEGDILHAYGLVGLLIWPFIRDVADSQRLLRTGILLYLLGSLSLLLLGWFSSAEPSASWLPDAAAIDDETVWRTQGGWAAVSHRLDLLLSSLLALAAQYGWQLAGLMMIGAALLRNGWLRGEFSRQYYCRTGWLLLLSGMAIELPAIILQWQTNWDFRWSGFFLQAPREISAPLQSLGYVALIFAYWPLLQHTILIKAVTAVGRMALSNYLLQTLICSTLFYYFAGFNQFSRLQLLCMVPGIWLVNLLFSSLWLMFFQQGPMEWLWRRLTALRK